MTGTKILNFSQAAQQAQHWVNEVAGELDWDVTRAYRLLRAVLHALRDWLPPEEMSDLAAQLPVLIRGVFFESWRPLNGVDHNRRKGDFKLIPLAADCIDHLVFLSAVESRVNVSASRENESVEARVHRGRIFAQGKKDGNAARLPHCIYV